MSEDVLAHLCWPSVKELRWQLSWSILFSQEAKEMRRIAWMYIKSYRLGIIGHPDYIPPQPLFMAFINGSDTEVLAHKDQFMTYVRKAGFPTPRQVTITPQMKPTQKKAMLLSLGFNPNQLVFCKRVNGFRGYGIYVMPFKDVLGYLIGIQHPHVVQEAIPNSTEVRFIAVQDEVWRKTWRVCYKRHCPEVCGDGKSSLWSLIWELPIPLRTKIILLRKHKKLWRRVLPQGKKLILTHVANTRCGGYETLFDDASQVSRLDEVMTQFIRRLEDNIGHSLPLLCFDVVIRDWQKFLNGTIEEAIAQTFIIECQIPFVASIFFRQITLALGFLAAILRSRYKQ